MIRRTIAPRKNWPLLVQEDGLLWHSTAEQAYWNESAYYEFKMSEIETLEQASREVYDMLLRIGEVICKHEWWLNQFGIPSDFHELIAKKWDEEPPALNYGRFDWGYNEEGVPKLFEFNCDTPTSLLEASVIQWKWKEQVFPDNDQWNSIHESLVEKWKDLRSYLDTDRLVYFVGSEVEQSGEDLITLSYLSDTAREADFQTRIMAIDDIGVDEEGRFIDDNDFVMERIFKLYPWECLVNEAYRDQLLLDKTLWIEPIWKMLWSNKCILPALYSLEPNSPWLLPATLEGTQLKNYVKKPILGREGGNVTIVKDGNVIAQSGGEYGEEGYVYQELFRMQNCDGKYPLIGTWVVDGSPCGMGIREDGLITGNVAQFVPHIIA